jgi:hypothetical protein
VLLWCGNDWFPLTVMLQALHDAAGSALFDTCQLRSLAVVTEVLLNRLSY